MSAPSRPPGIGHNRGPAFGLGRGWQRHCWKKARADLLPKLPLEIIRIRVRRAKELGLDYPVYATVRATTGQDIVSFLFSTNALRLFLGDTALKPRDAERLAQVTNADRAALTNPPLEPAPLLRSLRAARAGGIDRAAAGPIAWASPAEQRRILDIARCAPAAGTVLVGDAPFEQQWVAAARLAAYLPADRFFGPGR